jgi:hypothetical protein
MKPYVATLYDSPAYELRLEGPRYCSNLTEVLSCLMRWDSGYHYRFPTLRAVLEKHTGAEVKIRYWDFSRCPCVREGHIAADV